MKNKEIKEEIMEEEMEEVEEEKELTRDIQKFLDEMRMLGEQINNKDISKPAFNFGDLSVTNYLLWLMLGELSDLNSKMEEDDA